MDGIKRLKRIIMNSSNTKNKLKIAAAVAATVVLAAGCRSSGHYSKSSYNQTPLAMTADQTSQEASMGGTGAGYEMQTGGGASTTSDQYAGTQSGNDIVIPLEKETLRVGTQSANAGGVRIRKFVKTEMVSQPVQVRTESVTVDRIPANAQAGAQSSQSQMNAQKNTLTTPFKEGEMTINLQSEQPFTQTQIVPAGSVVIHKQVTTQPMNVQGQVRSEDVEAVKIGNPQNVSISKNLTGQGLASTGSANEASGAAPSTSGQSSGGGGSEITQFNQLNAAPASLEGRRVDLNNAKVQQVIGEHLIAIAPAGGPPVFVHVTEPISGITAGQSVNVKGRVRQVPPAPSSLGFDQQSNDALQGQRIVIIAHVTPANQ
jgi:stress response protein YsnF